MKTNILIPVMNHKNSVHNLTSLPITRLLKIVFPNVLLELTFLSVPTTLQCLPPSTLYLIILIHYTKEFKWWSSS